MRLHEVALLSDAHQCFAVVLVTLLSEALFLFCFHPAQLPVANFTSVLDCKMSLDIQMPCVLSS